MANITPFIDIYIIPLDFFNICISYIAISQFLEAARKRNLQKSLWRLASMPVHTKPSLNFLCRNYMYIVLDCKGYNLKVILNSSIATSYHACSITRIDSLSSQSLATYYLSILSQYKL